MNPRCRGLALLLSVGASCATAQPTPPRSLLAVQEVALVRSVPEKKDGGFGRFWRSARTRKPGLLKWADNGSAKAPSTHAAFLEVLRDEVGRLNQEQRLGEDVTLLVNVYQDEKPWFRARQVSIEMVGRSPSGELVWAALDTLSPSEAFTVNAADSEELILARHLVAKLRKELAL